MQENRSINAKEIVDNPDIIHTFHSPYILVRDQSLNKTFTNLMIASTILFERGWDIVDMESDSGGTMFFLLQNPHAKRKRDKMSDLFDEPRS